MHNCSRENLPTLSGFKKKPALACPPFTFNDLTLFSTLFQSYQGDVRVIIRAVWIGNSYTADKVSASSGSSARDRFRAPKLAKNHLRKA